MERYLQQLVDDLKKAAKNAPQPKHSVNKPVNDEQSFLDHIKQVELYLHGPREKLSDIIGVPLSILPGDKKLTDSQLEILVDEMIKLWQAWNIHPEYPQGVPARMLYQAMRREWESEQSLMDGGMIHIGFCCELPEECAFPGYCEECEWLSENMDEDFSDFEDDDDFSLEEFNEEVRKNQEKLFGVNDQKRPNMDDEGFISGIFNYCDRWCERCDFTEVCRTFAMEKEFEQIAEEGANEPDNGKDDEEISEESFYYASEPDDTDDGPVDDSIFDMDTDDYDDPDKDFFSPQNKAERHPLTVLVDKFVDNSHEWIEEQHNLVGNNFTKFVAIGDPDELMEAFEIVLRYHFFVPVKLRRALHSYFELEENEEEAYDMNGTAKVMLMAMDDSLAALKVLKRFFKDKKTIIKKLIVQLTEMLTEAEKLFPNARKFIRPGLDE